MTIEDANQWWLWGNTVLLVLSQAAQVAYAWWVNQRAKRRAETLKEELAHREMLAKQRADALKDELSHREMLRLEYQKDISVGMTQVKEQTNGNIVELKRMLEATLDRLDHVVKDRDYFRAQNAKLMDEVLKRMDQQKCHANAAAS